MGTDKFCWLRAVYADPRFPAGEKAVLAYVTAFSVKFGEDTFHTRQSTLADAAHSGISRQTVGSAIRRAKRHGYLGTATPRKRGTNNHAADELQLLLPAKSKEALHNSHADDTETAHLTAKSKEALHNSGPELCKANGVSDVKQTAELCKAANSSTSENDTPIRSSNRSLEGSGEKTPLNGISIEPPKRACTRYPHSDPCGTCASDNRALDAWKQHGSQQLSVLQQEVNKLERQQGWTEDDDHRRELGQQIRVLRSQRTRWLVVLRAEGVPV